MSIADKLVIVAENVQKVYEAGRKAGGGGVDYDTAYNEGYDKGYTEGETTGYSTGHIEGKNEEKTNFWTNFLSNRGNDFSYIFYNFPIEAFYPNVNIVLPPTASRAFYMFGTRGGYIDGDTAIDLVERLTECGITIDFSKVEYFDFGFGTSLVATLPVMDFTSAKSLSGTFNNCKKLTSIEKIILKDDGSQTFDNLTFNAPNLKRIRFEGVIGKSVSFANCLEIDADSIDNIISVLADLTGQTTQTITFPASIVLTDEQKAVIASKNWTLVQQ